MNGWDVPRSVGYELTPTSEGREGGRERWLMKDATVRDLRRNRKKVDAKALITGEPKWMHQSEKESRWSRSRRERSS